MLPGPDLTFVADGVADGTTATVGTAAFICLWQRVCGARPVQVVLVRDCATASYDIALATTDLIATPAAVIERYASRWSIKVATEEAKQIFGAGQARNRLPAAVHRTIPFTLACQSLAILWYATAGHYPTDVDEHRARTPCYITEAEPSTADMTAKVRRVLMTAKYRPVHLAKLTPSETYTLRLAWDDADA